VEALLPRGARGYASLPGGPNGARRGAVVLHELYGRQPEIDRVVDRFAAAGYAAVAPDLWGDTPRPLCLARAIVEIQRGQGRFIDVIRGARDWLCGEAKLPANAVGLIGFCMGGGFALAAGGGFGAVSTNYGPIPPDGVLARLPATIGCYGVQDRIFGGMGPVLERRLGTLGVPVETHSFEEVGHSFLTDGHHPVAAALSRPLFRLDYRPEVAERAWKLIFDFFGRTLVEAPESG
jgi:carboxymethylenebutenolidase